MNVFKLFPLDLWGLGRGGEGMGEGEGIHLKEQWGLSSEFYTFLHIKCMLCGNDLFVFSPQNQLNSKSKTP